MKYDLLKILGLVGNFPNSIVRSGFYYLIYNNSVLKLSELYAN